MTAESFIMVAINSRDQYEIIGLRKISYSTKQPSRSFCLKKALEMHQSCSILAKHSRKSNISIYSKILKFQALSKFRLPIHQRACLPAVRPGYARCRPPDFYRLCTVQSDSQISWSTEDSPTAPSSFLLTIIGLPSSSLFC